MRDLIITAVATLLLLLIGISEAAAYPQYAGPVVNSGAAFSEGQIAGLQTRLRELEAEVGVRGFILALPEQDTWDLQGFTSRTLEEWQAQGVVDERCFLLVLVPAQHRMALAFDPALTEALDAWTARQLADRVAVMCERGELYNASQLLITHLHQAPELQPKSTLKWPINWSWIAVGLTLLICAGVRHLWLHRHRQTREQQLGSFA